MDKSFVKAFGKKNSINNFNLLLDKPFSKAFSKKNYENNLNLLLDKWFHNLSVKQNMYKISSEGFSIDIKLNTSKVKYYLGSYGGDRIEEGFTFT